jgi:putative ABC transport system permease protein
MTMPDRVYRSLLRLFPRPFRERFGDDMTELFRDQRRAARRGEHRWRALLALWIRASAGIVRHAVALRLDAARAAWPGPARSVRSVRSTRSARTRKEPLMAAFTQDLRLALFGWRRQPGFAAIAVMTLALGIGANVAIFSIVKAVLLLPPDYPGAERLVWLYETTPKGEDLIVSIPNVTDWLARSRSLEAGGVFTSQTVNLTGRETPDRVRGGFVSAGFLDLIGATTHIGRGLTAADDRPGAAPVVALQYDAWTRRFDSDPAIVGKTLVLNNEPHTIVGVMRPGLAFLVDHEIDIWMPAQFRGSGVATERGNRSFLAFGRLRPGVSLAQARADLANVGEALARLDPTVNAGRGVSLEPFPDRLVGDARRTLLLLSFAVACVLLIACVNLANLLLARGAGRTRELALRAALGASRWRLLRQLLTESVALAAAGGAAGLLLAHWGVRLLAPMVAGPGPLSARVSVNGDVLLFTLALSIITGLLFGLLPALRLSRTDLQATLRAGGRGTDDRVGHWIRDALVVSEVALSLVLLVGAGLLVRSLVNLLDRAPGFNADHVLSLEYRLPQNKYAAPADQWRFHEQVVERVRQVPGVTQAALAVALSFSGNGGEAEIAQGGRTTESASTTWRSTRLNTVTPDYFQTMQIPLREGRACTAGDRPDGPRVAIVNRHLADQFWPGASAVGQTVAVKDGAPATVVGVVGDTQLYSLAEPPKPQIYFCYAQSPFRFATLVARTAVEPLSVAEAVKAAIWSIDRDQPVWKVRTAQSLLDRSVVPARVTMQLVTGAAALALLLAVIGIYGVMSHAVSQRTREIGVRLALGAERRDIARLVLGRGLLLTGTGVLLGGIGARWIARLLDAMLIGVGRGDAVTYAGVALLLVFVAMAACAVPARRAMRVDPVTSLRAD